MWLSEVLLPVHCLQAAFPLGRIAHTLTQVKQLINTGYLVSTLDRNHDMTLTT